MRAEKSPAEHPQCPRGFWLLTEFDCKDDASNDSGVPRMQSSIQLSPLQLTPGLGWRHSHDPFPQENWYDGIVASRTSLNVSIGNRLRPMKARWRIRDGLV